MRLATALVAAVLAQLSIATSVADACGGYFPRPPEMHIVANHHGRTFVLLDKRVPKLDDAAWWRNTHSYDWTQIAAAPAFPSARKLTLVGPDHTRRVSSAKHVFVKPVFETRDAMNALELLGRRDDDARIAIAGELETAAWTELEYLSVSDDTVAWAKNPGFSPALDPTALSVTKAADLELVTARSYGPEGRALETTYVRAPGARPYGGYLGHPMGIVTLDGKRWLVLVNDGLVNPIEI